MKNDEKKGWIERVIKLAYVRPEEWRGLVWSFVYFFSLLTSYYIIRPMREEMGIAGGVEKLQWMFSGTFLAMLVCVPAFGWIARRFPIRRFMPYVYYFFILNLLIFFILFKSSFSHVIAARAFFIWTSVFNLFIVSVFWSFMTDVYNNERAGRLFGLIAAGGSIGAVAGPAITAFLVLRIGTSNMLLISIAFLGFAVLCIHRIIAWRQKEGGSSSPASSEKGMGGGVLAGIELVFKSPYLLGICIFMLLYTTLSTFLYFQQAYIIRANFSDPAKRTALFAGIDFSVNMLTLLFQFIFTSRIIKLFGVSIALAAVPVLVVAGFLTMGFVPVLAILIVFQVLRRAGDYSVTRPAREMLFVVLSREEKYKAKNFIDTVIYRAGDAFSAWVYTALQGAGLAIKGISMVGVVLALFWAIISFRLGSRQEKLATSVQAGQKP